MADFYTFLSAREEGDVCTEVIFTVVHQQGEFMESQRAVGRHTEEGEELTGAWRTRGDTGGAGDPMMHLMFELHICLFQNQVARSRFYRLKICLSLIIQL